MKIPRNLVAATHVTKSKKHIDDFFGQIFINFSQVRDYLNVHILQLQPYANGLVGYDLEPARPLHLWKGEQKALRY